MVLACHVILHHHLIKGPYDFREASQGKSPSSNFSGYRDFGRGEIMTLVCHVIFQDHVIKVLCDYGQEPITLSYYPVKLGGHRHGSRTILLWTIIPRTISPCTTAS